MVLTDVQNITFTNQSTSRLVHAILILLTLVALTSFSVAWMTQEGLNPFTTPQPIMKQLMVIDTDPGIDDAMAILTALGDHQHQVLGISCVRGNTDAPNVLINALKILIIAGRNEIPVFNSFNLGLLESPPNDNWFGKDGLGDLPFSNPPSPTHVQKEHSATFLARIVQDNPGKITVVAIGPLTNLALALHLNENFLKQAKKIIILGGSVRGFGNAAPGIEFNFFMDPSAASIVLDQASASGIVITLFPMETVLENELTMDWRWNSLAKINNSVVSFLNQLERKEQELHPSFKEYHPYDTYAVLVALNTDVVKSSRKLYGYVENRGQKTNGALMIDYLNVTGKPANLDIIMDIDTAMIKKVMYENLSSFK